MIFLSSFQLLGPIQKLVSKFSIQKLKTKVENPKVGHDFSFKISTWKPVFGKAPKVENLTEKSCPTFGFSTLVFHFQVENLETNFWEGPKSRKLERKIMSYVRAFKFGFQLWFWIFKAKKTWQEPVQPSRGKKVIKRYASSNRVQRVDPPPRKGILRVRIADFGRWSPLLWRGGW